MNVHEALLKSVWMTDRENVSGTLKAIIDYGGNYVPNSPFASRAFREK